MAETKIVVVGTLQKEVDNSDERTKKLFYKQKQFMERYPYYNSLGRKKLRNVVDKYGNNLWEIRLDRKRRIVFVERDHSTIVWLKICEHDELTRRDVINIKDNYL